MVFKHFGWYVLVVIGCGRNGGTCIFWPCICILYMVFDGTLLAFRIIEVCYFGCFF